MTLAASQIVGLVMVRHVIEAEPLASLPPGGERVRVLLAPALQRYLVEYVDPRGPRRDPREWRPPREHARAGGLARRSTQLGAAQGFGKRIGDGTTVAISRLTDIGVGRSLETGLARTERTLAKLDEGTYGLCDACGEPIPPARLEAMPDSVLCVGVRGGGAEGRRRHGGDDVGR